MFTNHRHRRQQAVSFGRGYFTRDQESADANQQQTAQDATHEASPETLSNYRQRSLSPIRESPEEIPDSQPDPYIRQVHFKHEDLSNLGSDLADTNVKPSDAEEPNAADNAPAHSDDTRILPSEVQDQQSQEQLISLVSIILSISIDLPFLFVEANVLGSINSFANTQARLHVRMLVTIANRCS